MHIIRQFIQKPVRNDLFVYDLKKKWLSQVLEIETDSPHSFWGEEDFLTAISDAMIRGYVAVRWNQVVGYVVFRHYEDHFDIINLAVANEQRREGIGSILIDVLKKKKIFLTCDVRESNTQAHLFLKHNGFQAKMLQPSFFQDYWCDLPEDAYHFMFGQPQLIHATVC